MTELTAIFEAKIVDVGYEAMTIMVAGEPDKLDAFSDLVKPFGIVELQRTGRIALPELSPASRPALRAVKTARGVTCTPDRDIADVEEPRCPPPSTTTTTPTPALIADKQGRDPRLRLAGPRARAEPEGLRHRRDRRPARGLELEGEGRGGRAARCCRPATRCARPTS